MKMSLDKYYYTYINREIEDRRKNPSKYAEKIVTPMFNKDGKIR